MFNVGHIEHPLCTEYGAGSGFDPPTQVCTSHAFWHVMQVSFIATCMFHVSWMDLGNFHACNNLVLTAGAMSA